MIKVEDIEILWQVVVDFGGGLVAGEAATTMAELLSLLGRIMRFGDDDGCFVLSYLCCYYFASSLPTQLKDSVTLAILNIYCATSSTYQGP